MGLKDLFKKNKEEDQETEEDIASILPDQIFDSGTMDLQDIIAPAAIQITSKSINLGEKVARTLFVVSYPRFLASNWFSPIINLDKVFNISVFIHPVETGKVLRQMQKKVAEVQSQIHMREEKGLVRDPVLDTAYQDLEDLRDKLQQATEKLFNIGLYLTIYADTDNDLDNLENEVKGLLDSKLVYIKPALFQQQQGFESVIPLGIDKLEVHYRLNSAPLSSMFPFVSFDLTSDKGILYGVNRHNSSLVLFDRFSMENYNSVIFAKSGSGKSYTTKLEILRSLMFETEVIVIDPEREYEYLSQAVGGKYFNISLTSRQRIQPS